MKKYIVEVVRHGYREVEAIDCEDAEQTASDLNACDGIVWSDFVDVVRAWEKGVYKEFTGNGMCFVDLNAECCYINGIVHDGQLYINENDVIVCL